MTRFITNVFLLFSAAVCCNQSFGQSPAPASVKKQIIGLTPPRQNTRISGLAIGLTARPWSAGVDTMYVAINGLNIEAGPFGIIGGIYGTMFGLVGIRDSAGHKSSLFSQYGYQDSLELTYERYGTKINGISISLGGINDTYNKGVIINGLSGIVFKTYGVQISGLINMNYEFKGLMIAGLANKATIGNGLQIGLINSCQSGHVFQIGLFNRIGKRVLPFMNFRF